MGVGLKDFVIPDNLIIPNFLRKHGDKVIQTREETGKREERTLR
jgi:hypothetical protein